MKHYLLSFFLVFAIQANGQLSVSFNTMNSSCSNICSGYISSSVSGGTEPYTYNWSTGGIASSITSLCAGTYFVTVTDAQLATASAQVSISNIYNVTATISTIPASCDNSYPILTVDAKGGPAGYTYKWSLVIGGWGYAQSKSIQPTTSGSYSVTVTSEGIPCTASASAMAVVVPPITASASSTPVVNGNDGTASINVSGGISPYTYKWNTIPAQFSSKATGLSPGSYSATVTDVNSCSTSCSVNIGLTVTEISLSTSDNFSISLSPNPFSETATLRYSLPPYTRKAILNIYDVRGSLVKYFLLDPSATSTTISGEAFRNGVYFCDLVTDGVSSAKHKLVILK